MSAAPDVNDDLPRPFGAYLLLQNFARGGMGEVYLAKSGGIAGLERTCVLKKLRAELTRDREYVTRFIDEARVVVTLNHANICNVFDVGRVGDEYYLAMEYVSGRDVRTLQDRCRKASRAPSPATTLYLVCEVLEALDYAHRRRHPVTHEPLNLVHRDVSPQNVLVSYEGEVKLIDFGLAASRLKVERTQPNVVMGKMAYMAPEQARGDPIDARADLFACGVLAYELLANERFYEGMTAHDIWQVAGRGGFVPRAWDTLDGPLAQILARALHPDPRKRFATCGDFREALLGYAHERFPGAGDRALRQLMEQMFVEEIARERATLAHFGTITIASFRSEMESTQSHSVTLVRGNDGSSDEVAPPSRVVVDELTKEASDDGAARPPAQRTDLSGKIGGPMPPPGRGTQTSQASTDEGSPIPGNHDDPTRLDQHRPPPSVAPVPRIHDEKTVVTNPSQRTLRAQQRALAESSRGTEIVSRRNAAAPQIVPRGLDDSTEGVPGDTTLVEIPARRGLLLGAAAVATLVVIGVVLALTGSGDASPPATMTTATTAATTATTTAATTATTTATTMTPPPPPAAIAEPALVPLAPPATTKLDKPREKPREKGLDKGDDKPGERIEKPVERPEKPVERTERSVDKPVERPRREPVEVDLAFWRGLRKNRVPCVEDLVVMSLRTYGGSDARFVAGEAQAIRACAQSIGYRPK